MSDWFRAPPFTLMMILAVASTRFFALPIVANRSELVMDLLQPTQLKPDAGDVSRKFQRRRHSDDTASIEVKADTVGGQLVV